MAKAKRLYCPVTGRPLYLRRCTGDKTFYLWNSPWRKDEERIRFDDEEMYLDWIEGGKVQHVLSRMTGRIKRFVWGDNR